VSQPAWKRVNKFLPEVEAPIELKTNIKNYGQYENLPNTDIKPLISHVLLIPYTSHCSLNVTINCKLTTRYSMPQISEKR
jgi:hypothetical protein